MEDAILIDYHYFDDANKDGPCIVFNEEKSELENVPCYSVKHFSQIKPHTGVYIVKVDPCCFDRDCFYYCLKCVASPKNSVYYKDGTIVSVRWNIDGKFSYKGYYGNAFVAPIVDIVFKGNDICVRFYNDSIHFAGKVNKENVEDLVEILLKIMREAYETWLFWHENADLLIEYTQWVERYTSIEENRVEVENSKGEIWDDYRVVWPAFSLNEHAEVAKYVIDTYADVRFSSQLMKRTHAILDCTTPPVAENPKCQSIMVSLLRYIYDIGFEISKEEDLVKYFSELGYEITGHDANGTSIDITLVDENCYEDDHFIKRKDITSQSLKISKRGTIHHAGTGHKRHEIAYKKIMYDLASLYGS